VVLLNDLKKLLMKTDMLSSPLETSMAMRKCCRFLISLLHHCLVKIHLPISKHWTEGDIVEFANLLDEIGKKAPGLQLIEHMDDPDDPFGIPANRPQVVLRLKEAFFRVLPKLVNLREVKIYFFRCDDWALEQFGKHAKNIV
jgi:hypothetical protein